MTRARPSVHRHGPGLDVVSFEAKEAKECKLSKHFKSFIYWNPVRELWCIHEQVCGLEIATGKTEPEAVANAKQFLREANETMFYRQIEAFGPSARRERISWEMALNIFFNGRQQITNN